MMLYLNSVLSWFDGLLLTKLTIPISVILGAAAFILGIPILMLTLECFAALLPRPSSPVASNRPRIAVLMPAHNEEVEIAATLTTILPQLLEGDHLVVIADNCNDQTATIAQSMGATVVERHNLEQQGKGYALAYGLEFLVDDPPEVVVMIDADCEVRPETIACIACESMALNRPVQALYLMDQPANPDPKAAISTLAFLVKNWVRPRGLDCLGIPCLLTGTGMAFPWQVITAASLDHGNIVEDMQLAIDLAIAGFPPKFAAQGQVTGQLPQRQSASITQRMRWEHGHLQTLWTQVPHLWKAGCQQRRLDLLIMALDLSVPPLSLLVMLWGVCFVIAWLVSSPLALPGWIVLLLTLEGLGLVSSIIVAWARFGRDRLSPGFLLALPLYLLWKIPLYLAFLFRPQTRWVRTERDKIDSLES